MIDVVLEAICSDLQRISYNPHYYNHHCVFSLILFIQIISKIQLNMQAVYARNSGPYRLNKLLSPNKSVNPIKMRQTINCMEEHSALEA